MPKDKPLITLECQACFKVLMETHDPKQIPKHIECPHCGVGQNCQQGQAVSYSRGRNYPQDYFENQ